MNNLILVLKGGKGSGNFGHTGRTGKRGGSGGSSKISSSKVNDEVKNRDDDKNVDAIEQRMSQFPSDIELTDPEIVTKVSKNSGVSEQTVEKFISSWNGEGASNRFAISEAVRQELGSELGIQLSPFETENRENWLNESKLDQDTVSDYRKIARTVYNDTQEQLKELGSSEVLLYRGISGNDLNLAEGDTTKWHGNGMDSWSTGASVARGFASRAPEDFDFFSGEDPPEGLIIKSMIPATRIFSMASSGPGTSEEREMIVFGNGSNDEVYVSEITEDVF